MGVVPESPEIAESPAVFRGSIAHEFAQLDERLWLTVFELAPIPLSLVSPSGRQLAGNAAYRAYLGYGPDDLDELDVARTTRPEDQAWTRAYLERLVAGDLDHYSTEKLHVRRDGTLARARLDVTPIRRDGACIALLGVLSPVDDRQPMADGLMRKLVENIHDTISLVDEHGRLIETSGRYKPIMGYPSEFWASRSIFDLLAPGQMESVIALQQQVLARPGESVSGEIEVISAENTIETLEIHAVNLLDDPEVHGIVLTSRNVSPHKRLVAELRSSRDDAVAEAELRSRVLATVSHELRNPLHAVQGISELLSHGELPDAERDLAGTINRQIRDLTRVVDDLLTTSRLELGSMSIELAPVDLRSLLTDVVAIARTTAQPGVDVNALIDPSMPALVRTDPVRLRQVMSNLVGNAVKFTSAGRVRVLASVEGHDRLVLEVVDTGDGIPADELRHVFEPFRSATTAGRRAGAGLGLSIVQRIVAMLGGTVDVTSEVGVGTTFRLVFPLEAVEIVPTEDHVTSSPQGPTASAPATASAPVSAATAPAAAAPVLVVEDNVVNQQLARAQLRSLGHACHVVGSGEEALAHLRSADGAAVEVVLMDYHLPGIDGLETTRRIRDDGPAGRRIAIVGVTASASLADRAGCLDAGMDDYVPKPVGLADLAAAFERIEPLRVAVRRHRAEFVSAGAPNTPGADDGAGSQPVLDVARLEGLVDELGDRATVAELVATFLGELDPRIDGIVAARAAGDTEMLRRLVHTITSSARLVGGDTLAQHCAAHASGELGAETLRASAASLREQLTAWVASTVSR